MFLHMAEYCETLQLSSWFLSIKRIQPPPKYTNTFSENVILAENGQDCHRQVQRSKRLQSIMLDEMSHGPIGT